MFIFVVKHNGFSINKYDYLFVVQLISTENSGSSNLPDYNFHLLSGYGKTVSHVIIGLKTAKGTKQLKLDPSIYESLQKEKVETGDVIYIEANSGAVKVISINVVHFEPIFPHKHML